MKDEKKTKKGFFGLLRESLTKTGGCCGAGETCGTPPANKEKGATKNAVKPAEAKRP